VLILISAIGVIGLSISIIKERNDEPNQLVIDQEE
jgi:hypothetical protein